MREVSDFMENPDRQVFYLAGFAGTGKTTLAKHFADGVSGLVLYGAFTGKAALVLRQKGCLDATTIHSLIYISRDKSKAKLRELEEALAELLHQLQVENGPDYDLDADRAVRSLREHIHEEETALKRPMFVLNPDSPVRDASLLIIDECSMVDETIGKDLLSFGVKILVLGDPFQLPPVFGTGFFTSQTPDFTLTEIHRQAKDSPVLRLATDVREGRPLRLGTYGESRVILQSDIILDDVLLTDQMLVGRNETRRDSNVRLRRLQYKEAYSTYPLIGDRVVCLRNDHEMGLLNGAIWNVLEAGTPTIESTLAMRIKADDGSVDNLRVTCHTHYFEKRGDKLPWYEKKNAQEFDYGYALTVHKSQGSQWDDVLLFDESHAFREYRNRWLYTGITRAAKRITVVRM